MSFKGREIERKLVADSLELSLFGAETLIRSYLRVRPDLALSRVEEGDSSDIYWNVPGSGKTFIRTREYSKGLTQLTVKKEDRSGTLNRIEIDLNVTSKLSDIVRFNKTLYGPEAGMVRKRYTVFWLNDSEHMTISCYQVKINGTEKPFTFIEIEGTDETWVESHSFNLKRLNKNLSDAKGSLYTLFLEAPADDTIYSPI